MNLERFQQCVTTVDELTTLIGAPSELVIRKQLPELDHHMQSFIAQAPFLLLGTYGRDGRCDVSPRGGSPSVAKVVDSKTLVIAERPGNRRADSLQNILETGRVGSIFLIPGMGETLRVNGQACVIRDEEILASSSVQGKTCRRPVVPADRFVDPGCAAHLATDYHGHMLIQTALMQVGHQSVQRLVQPRQVVALIGEMGAVCIPDAGAQDHHRNARLDQTPGQQKLTSFPATATVRIVLTLNVPAVLVLHFRGFSADVECVTHPVRADHLQCPNRKGVLPGQLPTGINVAAEVDCPDRPRTRDVRVLG